MLLLNVYCLVLAEGLAEEEEGFTVLFFGEVVLLTVLERLEDDVVLLF